jgi:hypothetical protein
LANGTAASASVAKRQQAESAIPLDDDFDAF